jgi:hypothetical protein
MIRKVTLCCPYCAFLSLITSLLDRYGRARENEPERLGPARERARGRALSPALVYVFPAAPGGPVSGVGDTRRPVNNFFPSGSADTSPCIQRPWNRSAVGAYVYNSRTGASRLARGLPDLGGGCEDARRCSCLHSEPVGFYTEELESQILTRHSRLIYVLSEAGCQGGEKAMNFYTFKLEQFHIDNTGSRHQDTITVVFDLDIGDVHFQTRSLFAGDVNNGDHSVNLVFGPVLISDTARPAVFVDEIYNGDASKLPKSLGQMADTLLTKMVDLTRQTIAGDNGFPNFSSGQAGEDVPNPVDPFDDTSNWSTLFLEAMVVDIGSFPLSRLRRLRSSRWNRQNKEPMGRTHRFCRRYNVQKNYALPGDQFAGRLWQQF